ncbi:hypothetical protein M9H77_05023 [Catharanthus roseus]|uniref:Uncharacterized protein n=1 Tax=Catharanthus roseus TaxID=4058 RepID=A0ACC0CFU0_CATRO|nr:hypothetical protein M9H77_05023 [Catharanthus roseus]
MVHSEIYSRKGVQQLGDNFFSSTQISPGNERFKVRNCVRVLESQNEQSLVLCFQISFLVFPWNWFLKLLRQHVVKISMFYLISDRHKSILFTTQNQAMWQPPFAVHRFYLRHIRANFTKTFKNNELKSLIHRMMTTNISEALNSILKKIFDKFLRIELKSRDHTVITYNPREGIYIVKSLIRLDGTGNNVYTLNMNEKSYSCCKWREYILPCSHALAVYRDNDTRRDTYVPDIYLRKTYRRTYQSKLYSVGHEDFWSDAPYNLTFYHPNMNNQ